MKRILKRLLCLALCVMCMAQLLPGAAAQEQTEQTEIFYTSRVYSQAKSKASVMGHFENGRELTVFGTVGDYYLVDCYDMNGYIPKSQVRMEDEKYYVNCQEDSKHTDTIEYVTLDEAMSLRSQILADARGKLGCPYVYGAMGHYGFDCSGLTSYLYKRNGYQLTRRASTQVADGVIVSREGLQVGDLLFFQNRERSGIGHVCIYAGDGMMIHADSRGVVCTPMSESYYAQRYVCARRVINVSAAQADELTATTANSVLTRTVTTDLR